MPFFRYTATDSRGKVLSGTIRAKSPEEARGTLVGRGFNQVSLEAPPGPALGRYMRTARVGDRDLMFCFSQAASLIRAGVNPFAAFGSVGEKSRSPALSKACSEIAASAGEGGYPSSVMEKYIDVFPHNAVGMVRAGEHGGFLPEALEYLAGHYADSTAFKRWFWVLRFASWQGLLGLLFALPVPFAFWDTFHAGSGFVGFYVRYLLNPVLPILAAAVAAYLLLRAVFTRHAMVRVRHRAVLRTPWGIGARARHESLRAFLWTLRNLSHGGVAPGTAWALAASSVPNADYAVRLAEAGAVLGSERRLSDAMVKARLFPQDYDALLSVAEQTGDVVGTLDRMLVLTDEEFNLGKHKAHKGLFQAGCLITMIGSGLMMIYLVRGCYGRLIQETSVEAIMEER